MCVESNDKIQSAKKEFDAIAETAINDGASVVNPIMATKEQIIEILKAAK